MEEKEQELKEILSRMTLPADRFAELTERNLAWLNRNMGINNRSHPQFDRARELVRELYTAEFKRRRSA